LKLLRIKFIRLQWTGYKSEWIIIEYRKSTGWKIPWKKTCGKTRTEGKTSRGVLVAAKYKKVEDTIWGRTARAVAALKNSRKEKITIQKCHCTDIIQR